MSGWLPRDGHGDTLLLILLETTMAINNRLTTDGSAWLQRSKSHRCIDDYLTAHHHAACTCGWGFWMLPCSIGTGCNFNRAQRTITTQSILTRCAALDDNKNHLALGSGNLQPPPIQYHKVGRCNCPTAYIPTAAALSPMALT